MGLAEWVRLVGNLEKGDRCDLVIATGAGMTAIKVEADPRGQRLQFFDVHSKRRFFCRWRASDKAQF